MAAVPDPDNVLTPEDSNSIDYPVSFGAAEFRALKEKLNNLFLMTGIDAMSGPDTTEKLITTNGVGLLTVVSHNPVNATTILYGFATNVIRTGNMNHTVAAMLTAQCADGVTLTGDKGTYGVVTQALNQTNGQGHVIAAEFGCINMNPATVAQVRWGVYIVFKDRGDGDLTPTGGLGANQYNKNSAAIIIDSQQRGTAGEFCGWNNGIVFHEWSMDAQHPGVRGYCIDAYNLHYDGGSNLDTAFRVDAVLRMRTLQSIQWFDGVDKFRLTVNPVTGRFALYVNAIERFGVNMGTGAIYKNGVAVL